MNKSIRKIILLFAFSLTIPITWLAAQGRPEAIREIDSLNKQAETILDKKPGEAKQLATIALTRSVEAGYELGEASARSHLGAVHLTEGNNAKAIEACLEALKIFDKKEQYQNTTGYALTYIRLASAFYLEKDYVRGIAYSRTAIAVSQKLQDHQLLAVSYRGLGNNFNWLQQADSALYYYTKAKDQFKAINSLVGLSTIENNIGIVYFYKGDYLTAINHYAEALTLTEKNIDIFSYNKGLYNIAEGYYMLKSYAKAINYLDSAETFAKKFNALGDILNAYALKAKTYQAMGNLDSSASYYEKTIGLKDSLYNDTYRKELASLQTQSNVYKTETENKLLVQDKHIAVLYRNLAIAGIIVLIAILAFFLLNQRIRIHRRVKNKLEEEVALRTQEIFRQKETIFHTNLKLKLALNGAKFNSHFIYNVLHSIQQVVLQQKPQEAHEYLSKLSRLMQYVLKKSPLDTVSLEEEVEMLTYYIQLEQLRLNHQFTYNITVDGNEQTPVPAVLLQPYIEDAIENRIAPATVDNLHLTLHISIANDEFSVVITDNGLKRGKEKRSKQQVQGFKTGQERLDLLTHLTHKNHSVITEDQAATGGNESKTKVTLQIPLNSAPTATNPEFDGGNEA